MKNRIKNIIIFIICLMLILGCYFLLTNNIEMFITNYEQTIIDRPNQYAIQDKEQMVRQYLVSSTYEKLDQYNFDNEILINLFRYIINEDITDEKVEQIVARNKFLIPDTKYGDIIYMGNNIIELAFTEDMNNIFYSNNIGWLVETNQAVVEKYAKQTIESDKVELSEDTKKQVTSAINETLNKIGLLDKIAFDPQSILLEKEQKEGSNNTRYLYVLEDKRHNIKIKYNQETKSIMQLIIGYA